MPAYDSFLFKIPAPVAFITLLNPENGLEKSNVPMILDTGADISLIPKYAVENMDLDFSKSIEIKLEDFEGKKSVSKAVHLQLYFANQKFYGRFPLIEQDYGIIGRNILNKLRIELDGQNLKCQIL